jgi:iron complex transport system permease protein
VALTIGPFRLTLAEVVAALLGGAEGQAEVVVWNIRLPRVLAAMLVGAALAAAGASYQVLFRNPLVSPDILGVSSGAALGAVCGIFLSLPVIAIQGFAFAGGLGAVMLVIFVAQAVRGVDQTLVLVLTGVVMGALAGAATSLLKVMADPYDQLPAITFWLLGSLASTTGPDLGPVLPAVAVGLVPLILLALADQPAEPRRRRGTRARGGRAAPAAPRHRGGHADHGLGRGHRRRRGLGRASSSRISRG